MDVDTVCVYSVHAFAVVVCAIVIIVMVIKLMELSGKKPGERLIKTLVVLLTIAIAIEAVNLYCALKPSPCAVR
ncbi:MAG: hypothetical protein JHC33_05790 [Ignisphaera sp.]|nr:hypothetical protein [Ignisphaera sp.]